MPEITAAGFRHRGTVGSVVVVGCGLIVLTTFLSIARPIPMIHAVSFALGWMLMLAGGGMRLWATLYVGGQKNDVLVMDGPYSLCRNPLYLGTLLIHASAAAFFESPLYLVGASMVACYYYFATIPAEEIHLRSKFATFFDDYARRVPRLWPRWSAVQSPERIQIKVYALQLELRRMLAWIWIPVVAYILHFQP